MKLRIVGFAVPLAAQLAPAFVAGLPISSAFAGSGAIVPTGGTVTSGSATIGTSANGAVTIHQRSARSVIEWQDFSIGPQSSVTIQQPGNSAATLNRVTGTTPSTIAGTLTANGQVYLVNPNGIAITPSGSVAVGGGFVASTLGISNTDFNAGHLNFSGNGASAGVSNQGSIRTAPHGFVGLLGGQVANSGVIVAPVGKIGIGAGEQATLDLNGNGFLQVVTPTDATGRDGPLIDIHGRVAAPGGRVEIRAAAAQRAIHDVVNLPGSVSASSAHREGGVVVLDGGEGTTRVTGSATATSASAAGGNIAITGNNIVLSGARVNASGTAGGGHVSVRAGPPVGSPAAPGPAQTVTIDPATTIKADALVSGDGGVVTITANSATSFAGAVSAQALGSTGNGGSAEVSGGALQYLGTVNLLAAHGRTGTLLIDPYDVTISTGNDSGYSVGFTATASGATIKTSTLQSALATANVTVSTGSSGSETGKITVANAVSWSANTTLTLSAAGGIILNAGITNSGSSSGLTLTAGGSGGITGSGAIANSGTLTINTAAGSSSAYSGNITGGGSLTYAGPGTLTLSGSNTYSGGTTISGGTLAIGNTDMLGASGSNVSIGASGTLHIAITSASSATYNHVWSGAGAIAYSSSDTSTSNYVTGTGTGFTGAITTSGAGKPGFQAIDFSNASLVANATTNVVYGGTTLSVGALSGTGSVRQGGTGSLATLQVGALNTNTTYAGTLADNGSGINVVKLGTGVLTLTGTNTYSGTTSINGGTLNVGSSGALSTSGTISFGGGGLQYSASNQTDYSSRFSTAGSQSWSIDTNGKNVTFATALAGSASSLTKLGAGTLTLSGTNTYTGNTTVSAGTLQIGGAGSLGSGSYAGALSIASGSIIQYSSSATQTLSGVISGAGAVTKDTSSSATLTLSGANTYHGTTTVNAGTLSLTGSLNVGSSTETAAVALGAILTGPGTVTAGTLSLSGSGTVNLTGPNSFGTLRAAARSAR